MATQAIPVSAVVNFLRDVLEGSEFFSDLWVIGEVSNFTRSQVGHRYFSLRDQSAVLRSVLFRDSMPGTQLKDGDRVLAHGKVTVYPQRGDLQFVCDFVRPEGVGIHAARFELLRQKLEGEGLFDPARKRPLPRFPAKVGVVTSPTGAALQDIRQVLGRRWPLARLVVAPATVQGEQAVSRLLEALEELARDRTLDFVIIARGGGSAEDLSAFNDEAVARAVFGFPVPVVSGVGHETDWTLTDLVADLRAPTPSAAVERSTPDVAEIRRTMAATLRAFEARAEGAVGLRSREVANGFARVARATPDLPRLERETGAILDRMAGRILAATHSDSLRISELGARVAGLDPRATLARGFAIVEKVGQKGGVVRSVRKVRPGDRLTVSVSDGAFWTEVS